MSLILRSRESWLSATTRKKFQSNKSIREWLADDGWTPQVGMTKKRLEGAVHSIDTFTDAAIRDAIKLSIASFETAAKQGATNVDPRSCAWQFVRYYYASFFAANALMRLSGHACLNLTAQDCTTINSWADLHGVGGRDEQTKLTPSLYYLYLTPSRTPTVTLLQQNGKGGVHSQFWYVFFKYLDYVSRSISSSPAQKTERDRAINELNELKSALQRDGQAQANWLSEMRNAVNYRFEQAAWFPYGPDAIERDELRRSFMTYLGSTGPFVATPGDHQMLASAAKCSGFLVAWLKDAMEIVADRAIGEKRSLASGALHFASRI